MTMANCPEHGDYLIRIRLRHDPDDTWHANRLVYRADESMEKYFSAKLKNPNRRRRRRRKKAAE